MVFQTHMSHFKVLFLNHKSLDLEGFLEFETHWISPFWISSLVNEDVGVLLQPGAWQMGSLDLLPGNRTGLEAGAVPQSPPFHRSTKAKGRPPLVSIVGFSCLPLLIKVRHAVEILCNRKGIWLLPENPKLSHQGSFNAMGDGTCFLASSESAFHGILTL